MTTTTQGETQAQEAQIEELLQELTLEEKVGLLAGASMWTTAPIERLGIPAIKVSDGPNGARGGGSFTGGSVTAACFPAGIALASSWNSDLIEQIGGALAEEVKTKGGHMLLAPTVNIHRSPVNGRNFECYSEDPYLSARIAVAYINGLQSQGIGATVKHYVCNDSEFERNTISSEVGERALREIYLPPFEAAVREAHTWGVMAAYNKVNGVFASENAEILQEILKHEWGFDGIVMSDWFGTKSTADAANNGLDLEMPGPPAWRGEKLLAEARAGNVDMAALDEAARRMLRIIARAGAFEQPEQRPEQAVDRPEHRALIRRAGAEGSVLLKNRGEALPLSPERLSSIAIIGPNAKIAQIMGGGSAQVNAHYAVTPYDAIVSYLDDRVQVGYELGCSNHKQLPRLEATAQASFTIAYYNSLDLSGQPIYEAAATSAEQVWLGEIAPGVQPGHFSARLAGRIIPLTTGTHLFSLSSAGKSRLLLDGQELIDNWSRQTRGDTYFGTGSTEVKAEVELVAGRSYRITVEYSSEGSTLLAGVRLGYFPALAEDALQRAVDLAAQSDVALLFVGLNGEWESEGHDRPDLELVGAQNELVAQVAAANPNTIVVLQTGSPVTMPWLDQVAAVLQAWYPGQECGNAIADLLFGELSPSGKLTQTFPRRLEDNPAYINYPGENGRVRYGEGIYVGYRYYEKKRVEPLFPFGFGLSYTTFAYANLRLSADSIAPDQQLTVSLDVTNTGRRAGQEIVQLYVHDAVARVARPEKELKGFAKVALAPGETRTVTLTLDRQALAYWDDARHAWVAEAGAFELLVGSSSQDIRAQARFTLVQSAVFGGPQREAPALTVDSPIRMLLEDERARALLAEHLPGFEERAGFGVALGLSLRQIAGFTPEVLTEERLAALDQALARD